MRDSEQDTWLPECCWVILVLLRVVLLLCDWLGGKGVVSQSGASCCVVEDVWWLEIFISLISSVHSLIANHELVTMVTGDSERK